MLDQLHILVRCYDIGPKKSLGIDAKNVSYKNLLLAYSDIDEVKTM